MPTISQALKKCAECGQLGSRLHAGEVLQHPDDLRTTSGEAAASGYPTAGQCVAP